MPKNILIVGCGAIGMWHLKGLELSNGPVRVLCVDKDPAAFGKLQNFFKKYPIEKKDFVFDFCHFSNHSKVGGRLFDLAIIATTADSRDDLLEDLVKRVQSYLWICEKPIAQSSTRSAKAVRLMSKVNCFVNHPRRLMPLYKNLKSRVVVGEPLEFSYACSNLGLACNSSHFVDLVHWLTGEMPQSVDISKLNDFWRPTKREGFWDIDGELKVKFSGGSKLTLTSGPSDKERQFEVKSDDLIFCRVNESLGTISIGDDKNLDLGFLGQSEITGKLLDDWCKFKTCGLTPLGIASDCNSVITDGLLEHWNKICERKDLVLPFT